MRKPEGRGGSHGPRRGALLEVGDDSNRLRRIAGEFLRKHDVHLSRLVAKSPNLGVVLGLPELACHRGRGELGDEKAEVAPLRCVSLEYLDRVASNDIAASKLLRERAHRLDVLQVSIWIRYPRLDEEIRGHRTSRRSA